MANKLYEEENIRAIADAIRSNAPELAGNNTYTVEEMPAGIATVYSEGYADGLSAGGGNSTSESVGLSYSRNYDTYYVSGIGTCTDVDIVIPKTYDGLPVTGISASAFSNNSTIRSVVIPYTVSYISTWAFSGNDNLERVYIPSGIANMSVAAFSACPKLTLYCEEESRPTNWSSSWKNDSIPVVWGAVDDIWGINDRLNDLANSVNSGNGSTEGDGDNPEDNTSSLEMPLIRFIGLVGNRDLYESEVNTGTLSFSVEVVSGSLQVGDTIQMCGMRSFSASEKNPVKKRKLRRFAEYVITEENLNQRRYLITVMPTRNAFAHLGHNNRGGGGPTTIYFRVRRPVGNLQTNNSGMTVDAKFSNVVPVSMMYASEDGYNDDGSEYSVLKVNPV